MHLYSDEEGVSFTSPTALDSLVQQLSRGILLDAIYIKMGLLPNKFVSEMFVRVDKETAFSIINAPTVCTVRKKTIW